MGQIANRFDIDNGAATFLKLRIIHRESKRLHPVHFRDDVSRQPDIAILPLHIDLGRLHPGPIKRQALLNGNLVKDGLDEIDSGPGGKNRMRQRVVRR